MAKEEENKAKDEEKRRKLEAKKMEQAKKAEQKKGKSKKMSGEYSGSGSRKSPPDSGSAKTYPIRKRVDAGETSSYQKTHQDTCSVCFGLYKDDIDAENWACHGWL